MKTRGGVFFIFGGGRTRIKFHVRAIVNQSCKRTVETQRLFKLRQVSFKRQISIHLGKCEISGSAKPLLFKRVHVMTGAETWFIRGRDECRWFEPLFWRSMIPGEQINYRDFRLSIVDGSGRNLLLLFSCGWSLCWSFLSCCVRSLLVLFSYPMQRKRRPQAKND